MYVLYRFVGPVLHILCEKEVCFIVWNVHVYEKVSFLKINMK